MFQIGALELILTGIPAEVAVIIWKQQDRMCNTGHPGRSGEGLERLYEHVLWADRELKRAYAEFPDFMKDTARDTPAQSGWPSYIRHIASVQLLSMAHKASYTRKLFRFRGF